jgi:hypothetical protein
MYKVSINDIDLTKYCIGLPESEQAKEKLELFLLPSYEFTFLNIDNWLDSFDNVYFKDIIVKLIDTASGNILIAGNILEVTKETDSVKIKVGNDNDKYKELTKIGSWYNVNPCKIIKDICNYFEIAINEKYYNYTKATFDKENIRLSLFPDTELTFIELINKIKKATDLDIFISGNQLVIDRLNRKDNPSVFLKDLDILTASRQGTSKVYTNYNVKTVDHDGELADDTQNNLYSKERDKYGNVSLDAVSGISDEVLQIPTKEIGISLQEQRLKYYASPKEIFDIELPLEKYQGIKLHDVIKWQSSFFSIDNTFEITEKSLVFSEHKTKLKIQAILETKGQTELATGYGITPYDNTYGS